MEVIRKLEVIRKAKKEVKTIQLGDQIVLGRYTATAVAKDASGTTFCFDQVYGESATKSPWNITRMKLLYKSKAMENVAYLLVPVFDVKNTKDIDPTDNPLIFFRSPTAHEIFPKQKLRSVLHPDNIPGADKRWEIMKSGYRVATDVDGYPHAYWLDSLVNPESPMYEKNGANCLISHAGTLDFRDAEDVDYVYWRPVFKLDV